MSDYPGAIDEFRVTQNLPGILYDAADTKTVYAEDTNNHSNAIIAIEETLGVDPAGAASSVVDRLDGIDTTLAGKENSIGYTPENAANKSTSTSLGTSDTLYPTQGAVKSYVDTGLATKQATLGFTAEDVANKATSTSLGTSNTLYPTQNAVKEYVDNGDAFVYTQLSSGSITGANTFEITSIPQIYRELYMTFTGVSFANSTRTFGIQVSTDNGSTWKTTGYVGSTMAADNPSDAYIFWAPGTIAAARSYNGYVSIKNYLHLPTMNSIGYCIADNSSTAEAYMAGVNSGTGAVDAIRFICTGSGIIDGGSYVLYGIK